MELYINTNGNPQLMEFFLDFLIVKLVYVCIVFNIILILKLYCQTS